MRRIAEELDTGAASLYWHVGSKDGRLDLVFDHVIGEQEVPDADLERWQEQIKAVARTHAGKPSFGTVTSFGCRSGACRVETGSGRDRCRRPLGRSPSFNRMGMCNVRVDGDSTRRPGQPVACGKREQQEMLSIAFGLNRLDEQTPARQTRHHTVGPLAGVVLAGINAWWLMRAPAAITTGFSLLP